MCSPSTTRCGFAANTVSSRARATAAARGSRSIPAPTRACSRWRMQPTAPCGSSASAAMQGATTAATGATKPLTSLVVTKPGTWVLTGDGGFIARSPDGQWFTRVKSGVEVDLEAVGTVADGRVVAVGDRGIVLVSGDDGRTWKPLEAKLAAHQ